MKFRLVRNSDKTDGAKEFNTTLIADPAAEWWDNNPLPILRETKVGFVSEDKPGDDSDEGKPGDDSDEATPGDGGQDDKGKDKDGSDKGKDGSDKDGSDNGKDGSDKGKDTDAGDGKPLPRTSTETAGMIAAGIALLAVGAAAVGLTRARRN